MNVLHLAACYDEEGKLECACGLDDLIETCRAYIDGPPDEEAPAGHDLELSAPLVDDLEPF